jgi:hypothetical protein
MSKKLKNRIREAEMSEIKARALYGQNFSTQIFDHMTSLFASKSRYNIEEDRRRRDNL